MAMQDREAWEAAPEKWRKGVEGIFAQLSSLLQQYSVTKVEPVGELFDPQHHEAIGNEPVTDDAQVDTVLRVVQPGYNMVVNGETRQVRPPRVIVGSTE